jgi:hypothetical protein
MVQVPNPGPADKGRTVRDWLIAIAAIATPIATIVVVVIESR